MSTIKDRKEDVEGSESSVGSDQVSAITGRHSNCDEAKKENRVVNKLRILVSLVMVFTALAFGICVYLKARRDEREDFEAQ